MLLLGLFLLFFLPVVESFNRGAAFFLLYTGAILISFPILWKKRINVDLIDVLFLSFLTAATISTLFSISFLRSGIELSRYFAYFIIFIAIRNSQEEIERIKKYYFNSILINSFLLSLLLIIYQFFGKFFPTVTSGMNLFYPTFGHNRIADILIFLIPLLLTLKYSKYFLIFFSIMLAVSLGRGAMLSLPLAIIIFAFLIKEKRKDVKIGAFVYSFLAIIMVSGIFIYTYFFAFSNKVLPYYSGLFKPLAYDLRLEYFRQAIMGFSQSPIIGNGLDTFRYISQRYQNMPSSWSWYAHNHFLQLLNDSGFLGGTIFLMMTAVLFWQSFKSLTKSADNFKNGIFIALLATTIHSFIDYDWQYLSILLFVFFGFAILLPSRDEGKNVSGKLLLIIAVIQIGLGVILNLSESDRVLARADRFIIEGKLNNALIELEELERFDRKNKEIYMKKSQIYTELGKFDLAQNNLRKVKELNPLDTAYFVDFVRLTSKIHLLFLRYADQEGSFCSLSGIRNCFFIE